MNARQVFKDALRYQGTIIAAPKDATYRFAVELDSGEKFALPRGRFYVLGEKIAVTIPSFDDQFAYPVTP